MRNVNFFVVIQNRGKISYVMRWQIFLNYRDFFSVKEYISSTGIAGYTRTVSWVQCGMKSLAQVAHSQVLVLPREDGEFFLAISMSMSKSLEKGEAGSEVVEGQGGSTQLGCLMRVRMLLPILTSTAAPNGEISGSFTLMSKRGTGSRIRGL